MKFIIATITLTFVHSFSIAQETTRDSFFVEKGHAIVEPSVVNTSNLPRNNRIYDEYVGSYAIIYGVKLARGWRIDAVNGGFNKEVPWNPYLSISSNNKFVKRINGDNARYYFFKRGRKYSGKIKKTLVNQYTQESVIFTAKCKKGLLQGRGTLEMAKTGRLISECTFVDGEIVGECKHWKE